MKPRTLPDTGQTGAWRQQPVADANSKAVCQLLGQGNATTSGEST